MKTVLVTGSSGFIGSNLCAQLEQIKDLEILRFDRSSTATDLKKYIEKSDFVFHLAGINRPKNESEFKEGNTDLTEEIVSIIKSTKKNLPLLLTSSIHAQLDNPYGVSKKAAEDLLFSWSKDTGNPVYIYRLPNVFGKWCKPNYNSVVATFCNNIAKGLEIQVNDPEAQLNLVYIDDVVSDFIEAFKGKKESASDGYCHVKPVYKIKLKEIVAKLKSYKESRDNFLAPAVEDKFSKAMYATFVSYLDKDDFGYSLDKKTDQRGWLAEFIKSDVAGQIFASSTKPGFTRGNHWHNTKIEKFLVLEGKAEIGFKNIKSGSVLTYNVTGSDMKVVDVPPGYLHTIKNVGESDLITLIWASEIFDPELPDTYYLEDK